MELISSGKVDLRPLISIRYSLDRAREAFTAVRAGNVLKVVLNPGKEEA